MVTSLMTLCTTLVMLSPSVVHNSVPREEITCSNVSCNRVTSDNCPQWHFCNPRTGQCRPCGSCKDAVDNAKYETAALNCRDPTYCVTNYDFLPEHLCPRLKVNEGYQCSGKCEPCEGTLGHFLGTVCRFRCTDGDFDVFACTFLNERAQWNITRTPRWLKIESSTLPSVPSRSKDIITPARSVHPETIYAPPTASPPTPGASKSEFSTIVLVSAVVSVVVAATVVIVVAAICRRQKKDKSLQETRNTDIGRHLQEGPRETFIDPDISIRTNSAPDSNNNSSTERQNPRPIKKPVELSCRSVSIQEEENQAVNPQVQRRNEPTENSDTHCSVPTSTSQTEKNRNSCCFNYEPSSSGWDISLHSDYENSPSVQEVSRPNHPHFNFSNTTPQYKADNRRYIRFHPLNVDDETTQKYVH